MLSGEDEENGRKDALGKRQNENRMQMEQGHTARWTSHGQNQNPYLVFISVLFYRHKC